MRYHGFAVSNPLHDFIRGGDCVAFKRQNIAPEETEFRELRVIAVINLRTAAYAGPGEINAVQPPVKKHATGCHFAFNIFPRRPVKITPRLLFAEGEQMPMPGLRKISRPDAELPQEFQPQLLRRGFIRHAYYRLVFVAGFVPMVRAGAVVPIGNFPSGRDDGQVASPLFVEKKQRVLVSGRNVSVPSLLILEGERPQSHQV